MTTTPTPQRPLDSYETALLSELRGEVRRRALSPAAAPAPRPVRRRLVLAGASVAAVAAAVTVPLALGGSPAYAVSPNSDGSVTVTIQRAEDAAGLQQALADNGVAARVDYVPSGYACDPSRFTPASGEASGPVSVQRAGDGLTFTVPRVMGAAGRTLVVVMSGDESRGSLSVASAQGAVGDCAARPDTGALPPGATTHTSGPDAGTPGTAEPGRLTRRWSRNAAGPDQMVRACGHDVGSPDGIRTRATALRGRRARPLHNGALAGTRPYPGSVVATESVGPPRELSRRLAGVPGLEPRTTEPESAVLPITPYPMGVSPSTRHEVTAVGRDRGAMLPVLRTRPQIRAWRAARGSGPACDVLPRISIDSNSGGETRWPETAVRSGPNANLGLMPSPSTTASRRAASIAAAVHAALRRRAARAAGRRCRPRAPQRRRRARPPASSLSWARASSAISTASSATKNGRTSRRGLG